MAPCWGLADRERLFECGWHREPVQHLLADQHRRDAQWHHLQGNRDRGQKHHGGVWRQSGRPSAGGNRRKTGAVTMAGSGGNTIGGCSTVPVPTLPRSAMIQLTLLLALAGFAAMRLRKT